eukprot:gene11619-biopygen3204
MWQSCYSSRHLMYGAGVLAHVVPTVLLASVLGLSSTPSIFEVRRWKLPRDQFPTSHTENGHLLNPNATPETLPWHAATPRAPHVFNEVADMSSENTVL